MTGQAPLAEVVGASDAPTGFPGAAQRREQDGDEQREHADGHYDFNDRECAGDAE